MKEWLGMLILISPFILVIALGVGLSCTFMKTCPACKMRIPRRATKCKECHEYVTTKPKVAV